MSVPPGMMGAGPMIPPPPMGAPMAPPAGGPVPPAVAAMPGMAQLAQAQTMQMADHQKQMQAMQDEMQKQIMMLISSLPTPNPAGEAAVSAPLTPMMAGSGPVPPLPSADMTATNSMAPPAGGAPMGGTSSGY